MAKKKRKITAEEERAFLEKTRIIDDYLADRWRRLAERVTQSRG
ncbi:MAG TPA: hypothetical protein VFA05_10440 [Gaiellaceae bacterium]|nr:hypothetical protein [Gaiellaceae bacterium]